MTARNGSADWHGDVRTGSGTITVGDGVFSGPCSYDSRFGEHAEDAKTTCPVARALSGIPEIVLKATLTEGA